MFAAGYKLRVACNVLNAGGTYTNNFKLATINAYNFVLYTDMDPYREFADINSLMLENWYPNINTHLIPDT